MDLSMPKVQPSTSSEAESSSRKRYRVQAMLTPSPWNKDNIPNYRNTPGHDRIRKLTTAIPHPDVMDRMRLDAQKRQEEREKAAAAEREEKHKEAIGFSQLLNKRAESLSPVPFSHLFLPQRRSYVRKSKDKKSTSVSKNPTKNVVKGKKKEVDNKPTTSTKKNVPRVSKENKAETSPTKKSVKKLEQKMGVVRKGRNIANLPIPQKNDPAIENVRSRRTVAGKKSNNIQSQLAIKMIGWKAEQHKTQSSQRNNILSQLEINMHGWKPNIAALEYTTRSGKRRVVEEIGKKHLTKAKASQGHVAVKGTASLSLGKRKREESSNARSAPPGAISSKEVTTPVEYKRIKMVAPRSEKKSIFTPEVMKNLPRFSPRLIKQSEFANLSLISTTPRNVGTPVGGMIRATPQPFSVKARITPPQGLFNGKKNMNMSVNTPTQSSVPNYMRATISSQSKMNESQHSVETPKVLLKRMKPKYIEKMTRKKITKTVSSDRRSLRIQSASGRGSVNLNETFTIG